MRIETNQAIHVVQGVLRGLHLVACLTHSGLKGLIAVPALRKAGVCLLRE
jgi:hypothetical protein